MGELVGYGFDCLFVEFVWLGSLVGGVADGWMVESVGEKRQAQRCLG